MKDPMSGDEQPQKSDEVLLFEALDGRLTSEEKSELQRRLAASPKLRRRLAELKLLRKDLAQVKRETNLTPPSSLKENTLLAAAPLLADLSARANETASRPDAQGNESAPAIRSVRGRRVPRSSRNASASPLRFPLARPQWLRAAAAIVVSVSLAIGGYFYLGIERSVVAKVSRVVGTAFFTPQADSAAEPALITDEKSLLVIRNGGTLFTRSEGVAFYYFHECGDIALGPDTEVKVLSASEMDDAEGVCQLLELRKGMIWLSGSRECVLAVRVGSDIFKVRDGDVCVSVQPDAPTGYRIGHVSGTVIRQDGKKEVLVDAWAMSKEENLLQWLGILDQSKIWEDTSEDHQLHGCFLSRYDGRNQGLDSAENDPQGALKLAPKICRPMLLVVADSEPPEWIHEFKEDVKGFPSYEKEFVCVEVDLAEPPQRELAAKIGITRPCVAVTCPLGRVTHGLFTSMPERDDLLEILGVACSNAEKLRKMAQGK